MKDQFEFSTSAEVIKEAITAVCNINSHDLRKVKITRFNSTTYDSSGRGRLPSGACYNGVTVDMQYNYEWEVRWTDPKGNVWACQKMRWNIEPKDIDAGRIEIRILDGQPEKMIKVFKPSGNETFRASQI
jgi:hypothetical protein